MPRGGSRSGSGRKRGGANIKTRELADEAAKTGITPLEVMLRRMRELWDLGKQDDACNVAKDAAPYCHPRLSNVQGEVDAKVLVEVIHFAAGQDTE